MEVTVEEAVLHGEHVEVKPGLDPIPRSVSVPLSLSFPRRTVTVAVGVDPGLARQLTVVGLADSGNVLVETAVL